MAITLQERLGHATDAVRAYLDAKGERTTSFEDFELADLISDVMHLAHAHGFDIDLLKARAEMHFEAEQAEEGSRRLLHAAC